MRRFEDLVPAIEVLSDGKNKVIFDDIDAPSIMVIIDQCTSASLYSGGASTVHPAFKVGDTVKTQVGFSKFINVVKNSRAYSLPLQDPQANVTWDAANTYCMNKGAGWGLTPNALWAVVAYQSRNNKTQPHGNNNYGKDYLYTNESGKVSYTYTDGSTTRNGRTYTGSGPTTWFHDHTPFGIADLNGNVCEWQGGFRQVKGEPQFIPNANCMSYTNVSSFAASSELWKAIPNGANSTPTLACSSTANTATAVCFDVVSGKTRLTLGSKTTNANAGNWYHFHDSTQFVVDSENSVVVPNYLKDMAIWPVGDISDYLGTQGLWINPSLGETMPLRGGDWSYASSAGVWYCTLLVARTGSSHGIGFRACFYGL